MEKVTYKKILPYIQEKLISEQAHPEDPNVRIFNYTQKCQFDKKWDDITIQCRGLIMNIETGEVLARPFKKFFNYGEHTANDLPIPSEIPSITEKLDGSLGILYTLNGRKRIATRGAFMSDQAVWATEWFDDNCQDISFDPELTYLFEIIYPENRIVVNYDFSGLVLLACIDTKTGGTVDPMIVSMEKPKLRFAPRVKFSNISDIEKLDLPNSEGFVIHYPSSDLRLKIKFPEYVRLHKLVTGVSEIAIWEHLKDAKELDDLLNKVPDEFFKWVQSVEIRLRKEFADLWQEAHLAQLTVFGMPSRKEQAMWIMANAKKVSGVVFSLLDGHNEDAAESVWRMIRPHGNSQFKIDTEV